MTPSWRVRRSAAAGAAGARAGLGRGPPWPASGRSAAGSPSGCPSGRGSPSPYTWVPTAGIAVLHDAHSIDSRISIKRKSQPKDLPCEYCPSARPWTDSSSLYSGWTRSRTLRARKAYSALGTWRRIPGKSGKQKHTGRMAIGVIVFIAKGRILSCRLRKSK